MAKISVAQAYQYASNAGFSGNSQKIIVAIAQAESGLDTFARNVNSDALHTVDRGVLQINSFWHSEVTDSCAFDPQCAFNAGFVISNSGRSFTPWSTYTNGAYKQFMNGSSIQLGSSGSGPLPWYKYPRVDGYAGYEPFGNFPKPDSNIQCPDGTPITALGSGVISGVNSPTGLVPSWGACVTVKLDSPINSVATHMAYLHLQPLPSNIIVGKRVAVGDLIGYNGGAFAAGAQKVPVGFAFYADSVYGYGPTWSQYVGSPQLNPVPFLDSVAKNGIPGGGNTFLSSFGSSGRLISSVNTTLSPNANVTGVLTSLDQLEQICNPFDVKLQDSSIPVITGLTGINYDDPMQWLTAVGTNMFQDFRAAGFRLFLILVGGFLMYKAVSQFVDLGAVTGAAMNIGKLAALA